MKEVTSGGVVLIIELVGESVHTALKNKERSKMDLKGMIHIVPSKIFKGGMAEINKL